MIASPETTSARILLVDDNPTNLQVLYQTLEALGHKLLVAKSGEDAIKIAEKVQPALILLDIMMPGIDGFETCRRLKNNTKTQDSAVIFLSALDDTEDKINGLKLGAVDYVSKPFQAEEVIARVETQLMIHQLRQALALRNQELEDTNSQILNASAEGIYGLDSSGNIHFANPAASQLTGYAPNELIGRNAHDLHLHAQWDGTPVSQSQGLIDHTLRTGETTRSDEQVFWRQAGDHFAVEFTCAAIHQNGQTTGAVLVFQDISARKRQERALHTALAQVEALKDKLQAENRYLQAEVKTEGGFSGIVGQSDALTRVLDQIRQVAPTDSSVLIHGESGTGKEALARSIHDLSPRSDRPLIKVNCGAITPSLIESELFGHEKGAFTGALKQRQGYFELANTGTIFLDEVGELTLDAQVKLLRVLQEQEFSRVGSEQSIKVDVRVIAATNRDLAERVQAGEFRMDLFYRLNVFPLSVPPLRNRFGDIPLLVDKFLSDQSQKLGKSLTGLSQASMDLLLGYPWPGNIRELQNVVERAAILATKATVEIDPSLVHSGISLPGTDANSQGAFSETPALLTLAEAEANYIRQVLEHAQWTISGKGGAADILDIPPSTLRSRMKKLGIERPI